MNIRESIKINLKIENLEDYIVDQYILGKRDAKDIVAEALDEIRTRIKDIDDKQLLFNAILINLISLKKIYFNVSFFEYSEIMSGLKKRSISKNVDFSDEIVEAKNIADYILDFYDFLKLGYIFYFTRIKKVREYSKEYYIAEYFVLQSGFLFEELNNINKIEKFDWNWLSFEKGLEEVLKNNIKERVNLENDCENKIKIIKLEESHKSDDLNGEIRNLKHKIKNLKFEVDYTKEFFNKYYYEYPLLISETCFGDNQPFIYNLFLFLRKNNLYTYGWSYFYSCTIIGNNEIIPLECNKKQNIIGRILYNLRDFLKIELRIDYFNFLQSKFFINNKPIGQNFKTNHMKPIFEPMEDPFLVLIDDFFEKQKKLYNKL